MNSAYVTIYLGSTYLYSFYRPSYALKDMISVFTFHVYQCIIPNKLSKIKSSFVETNSVQHLMLFPTACILKHLLMNKHTYSFWKTKKSLADNFLTFSSSSIPIPSPAGLVAKNHPRIIHINTSHTFSCSSFLLNSMSRYTL